MKFRIRVDILNSGEKEYTPQVKLMSKKHLMKIWYNITKEVGGYDISQSCRYIHKKREDAIEYIDGYKKQIDIENSNKVKKTYYEKI